MRKCNRIAVVAVLLAVPLGRPHGAQVADGQPPEPSPRPYRIVVVQEVLDELARLADTAGTETARCLIGVMQGDSAIVDLLWAPRIELSNDTTVHYQACPLATIAEWHNHPRTAGRAAEDLCYLSHTDIAGGLRRHAAPIQIVQVSATVLCWWGRRQIATAAERSVLWPWAGQRTEAAKPLARH